MVEIQRCWFRLAKENRPDIVINGGDMLPNDNNLQQAKRVYRKPAKTSILRHLMMRRYIISVSLK